MQTREVFAHFSSFSLRIFYLVAIAAMAAFVVGLVRHILRYRRGRPAGVPIDWRRGLTRMLDDVVTHRTLSRRDPYAGIAHRLIFFSFATLFVGTSIITLEYDIVEPLTGRTFWKGWFYLIYSLVMDVAGAMLIVGLAMMIGRRAWFGLSKLDYVRRYRGDLEPLPRAVAWKVEDWVFLVALLLIAVSGFVQEAARLIVDNPPLSDLSPVGAALGRTLTALGLSEARAETLRRVNWWAHGVLALAFIAGIAWTKGKHMVAAFGSLAVRDASSMARLPAVPQDGPVGVARIDDFSWRDLLHFDACTKCGRCHEACPARSSGYPLSPRDLILDLRLLAQRGEGAADPHDQIAPETLWACLSCGACAEICPVGIEPPVKIVKMRRALVDRGEMDPTLRGVLETVANVGNSFGEPARKRGAWTRELEFPVKDARRTPVEALWFVGDFASFDPRSQAVSRIIARLFRAGGLDFGIMFEGERTAGNDVRRVGEEGLFEALSAHNVDQMAQCRFDWLVTTDPHSLNTLRNEYGGAAKGRKVLHYTNVLADWLEGGRLKVTKLLGKRVTYHDPCHLGRLNKEYDAPRRVLKAIGCELIEMPRSRDNSFCCGAGGGRIWMPDPSGVEKPSHSRMHEAAALGDIDVFVTTCPKDLAMFEDARKASGHEKDFVVSDLAELVAEAVALNAVSAHDLPELADRIADRLADKVAARVVPEIVAALTAQAGRLQLAQPVAAVPVAEPAEAGSPAPVDRQADADGGWSVSPVRPAVLADYARPAKDGLRVLVAVKHVGKLGDEFDFRPDGMDVRAEDLDYQLNEFDETAIEAALQLVERLGQGEVVVVTVGAEDVEPSLRRALAKGAHRGVRVWSDRVSPSDPIAVASLLAGVAVLEAPDLILTGVQSSDSANGATVAALGGVLGWPHAAVVVALQWDGSGRLVIERELEGGVRHRQDLPWPAVLSIQSGANVPRYATMRMIKEARARAVAEPKVTDLDPQATGRLVAGMERPPAGETTMLEGSAAEAAARIAAIIRDKRGI